MIPPTAYAPFLASLLDGQRRSCVEQVRALIDSGATIDEIYLDLFQPTMVEVGRLWERNRISVADEHLATALLEGLFSVTAPLLYEPPRRNRRVVLACVSRELHQIGARIVSDLFEWRGWDSTFVGANTPAEELFRLLESRKPSVLGLSMSMFFHLPLLLETLQKMVSRFPELTILIGGQGLKDHGRDLEKRFPRVTYVESGRQLLAHPLMGGSAG